MNYVIGRVGAPPRMILSVPEDDARRQLRDGEVIFLADALPGRWVIAGDGASLVAVPTPLEERRRLRWIEARSYRDERASGGCATPFGRIDSDPESRSKINGGSTAAIASKAAGLPFAVDWTMADNAVVPLDADAMIAVGLAVVQHVAFCQQVGTAIREQIEAAASEEALDAVDLTKGYPDA